MSVEDGLRDKHASLLREHGEIASHIEALQSRRAQVFGELIHLVEAAKLFGQTLTLPMEATYRPRSKVSGAPTVRDFMLAQLSSHPRGLTARAAIDAYERDYGVHLHPKTGGMTLYRLMREGLVHRKGRIWSASNAQAASVDGQCQVRR